MPLRSNARNVTVLLLTDSIALVLYTELSLFHRRPHLWLKCSVELASRGECGFSLVHSLVCVAYLHLSVLGVEHLGNPEIELGLLQSRGTYLTGAFRLLMLWPELRG